jgi:hypothetical protein
MEGNCQAACQEPETAMFCDGQYVDHGDNLSECIAAIEAVISATVTFDYSARGSSKCEGNTCEAEGEAEASATCSAAAGQTKGGLEWLGLLGAAGAVAVSRRRSRRRRG